MPTVTCLWGCNRLLCSERVCGQFVPSAHATVHVVTWCCEEPTRGLVLQPRA